MKLKKRVWECWKKAAAAKPNSVPSAPKKSANVPKPIVKKPQPQRLRRQLQQRLPNPKHLNLSLKKPALMPQHLRRVALHPLKRLSALSASVKKLRKLHIVQPVAQRMIAASRASLPLPARLRVMMVRVRVHSLR